MDGRIYIRADGETREANSEEVDLLLQRASAAKAVEVDFAVEVIGEIASLTVDGQSTVDEYVNGVRVRLMDALPRPEPTSTETSSLTAGLAGLSAYRAAMENLSPVVSALMEPERRSEEEYIASIDQWESRFRSAWEAALPKIAASQLRPTIVRITNRTTTFFHDVEVNLHLEGDVFAFDYSEPEWVDDFSDLELPHPPRKWGPTQRSFDVPNYASMGHLFTPASSQYIPPSISYKNGGSVDLSLDVGELRPRGTYESEDEEIVLIVVDRSLTSVHGTWELTARDHNDVYTGEIDVAVAANRDLTAAARQVLGLDSEADGEAGA